MVTAHLSAREARALGLEAPAQRRTTAPGPYHTRCVACGDAFRTMASETRHMIASGHRRFSLVLAETIAGTNRQEEPCSEH